MRERKRHKWGDYSASLTARALYLYDREYVRSLHFIFIFRFVYIFNFIVGGEVSVARIRFLSVSLAKVSPFLDTFYNIDLIYYCKLY